jgi:hypothetical protein
MWRLTYRFPAGRSWISRSTCSGWREKVKKTFQYRAQVAETATCLGGLSNTEKVKVKKRK